MKKLNILLLIALALVTWQCMDSADIAPDSSSESGSGVAGSYARFLTAGDFIYIVDSENIKTLNIEDPSTPQFVNEQSVGERIESIFRLEERLFIGSGSGMYLYTIGNDGVPQYSATYSYDDFLIYPCDPVVATDSFAYVTLNTVNALVCRTETSLSVNELLIFDVTDFSHPQLLTTYQLSGPKGLGIDGKILFVCDNTDGLKVFDVTDPYNLQLIHHFSGFTAYDVIPLNGLLMVVGPENVYQYDYSDLDNMSLISTIELKP